MPAAQLLATCPDDASMDVDAGTRRPTTDLRDAATDGRRLADCFSEVLKRPVENDCNEFEPRAVGRPARLESPR